MLEIPIRRLFRALGYDVVRKRPLVSDLLARYGIDTVFDVGANVGQYAKRLRAWGYNGRIVSFEPLPSAFQELRRRMRGDGRWEALNIGLGASDATMSINVSEATVFSSILTALPGLGGSYPESRSTGVEEVVVRRLDTVIDEVRGGGQRLFLKVDTQGYEREVLRGAASTLDELCGVQLEISLTPMYDGEARLVELVRSLEQRRFVVASVEPGNVDPVRGTLRQMDFIFVRP